MNENNNAVEDLTTVVFGFLSTKAKLIIIGIIIGMFFLILIPVIAAMSIGGVEGEEDSSSQTVNTSPSEVIENDKLYQYAGSKFSMPFEVWNTNQDVITSKFSKSRTITVNRSCSNEGSYWD